MSLVDGRNDLTRHKSHYVLRKFHNAGLEVTLPIPTHSANRESLTYLRNIVGAFS